MLPDAGTGAGADPLPLPLPPHTTTHTHVHTTVHKVESSTPFKPQLSKWHYTPVAAIPRFVRTRMARLSFGFPRLLLEAHGQARRQEQARARLLCGLRSTMVMLVLSLKLSP